MLLYLMRHGIAISRDDPESPPEAERHLTPKGIERTRAAARGLRTTGLQPGVALTSPYLRAVETAEIVCAILKIPMSQLRRTDALKPEAPPALLFEELSRVKAEEVICFGHAPHMDEAIAYGVRAPAAFTSLRKAGVACLAVELLSPPRATLFWLYTAKALRQLSI
jgi:phosphohistidine phosphatase